MSLGFQLFSTLKIKHTGHFAKLPKHMQIRALLFLPTATAPTLLYQMASLSLATTAIITFGLITASFMYTESTPLFRQDVLKLAGDC